MGNQVLEHLGSGEHAGEPGPGMGTRAHEVKAFDLLAPVVGAEPSRLKKDRLEAKARPPIAVETIPEIKGSHHARRFQALA